MKIKLLISVLLLSLLGGCVVDGPYPVGVTVYPGYYDGYYHHYYHPYYRHHFYHHYYHHYYW